ncbi:hypothetical protein [Bacillus thuringiensis]|uniref:Uncharacterized protein n=3 Tax=Bacillus cereus group TaxID=86661 RepID=A0ABD5HTY1_BACTU|nr:hypothetical protein [Bacillus thuringiensis]MDF9474006.1 hypothetical protein [Bacillus cereus]MCR6778401.1 hypothetical protein [Bacillus thuringiensis]MCR6862459.1 hypothetical protein [Bacillus thuringiensis]MCR6868316.1 hypothetical protein [Bacillus thuringiensis]MDW9208394.1 hypothetical protein [Bacillus thuringiensis serovar toumanoffi]
MINKILRDLKEVIKYLFMKIKESKELILIIVLVTAVFLGAFYLEFTNGKATGFLDKEFWLDNLLPNIIADMIGIVFTSFIIAGLFARNNKKAEEARIKGILGWDFQRLIYTLSRNYLYLLNNDENYLSFSINDNQVDAELKELIKQKGLSIDISVLKNNRTVWDVSQGSPIYDDLVVMIPKIERYINLVTNHLKDVDDLFIQKGKKNFELKQLEESSDEYTRKKLEYDKISESLSKAVRMDLSIDKSLLNISTSEAFEGGIKLYNTKIQEFNNKYNYIIPIDIRLSLVELEKSLREARYRYNQIISSHGNDSNSNTDDFLKTIVNMSKHLVSLSTYFKNVK